MDRPESDRPAKKPRIEAADASQQATSRSTSKQTPKWRQQQMEYKRQQRRSEIDHPQPESAQHRRDRELFGIDEDDDQEIGLKPLHDEEKDKLRKLHVPKMFSQPSVISTGDKGIFVTCDKGKEKKCLTDLADLVEDYLEKHDLIPAQLIDPDALLKSRLDRQQRKSATIKVDNEESPVEEEEEVDIESSINAELSGLKSPRSGQLGSHQSSSAPVNVRAFQLITLDIPCVSFLRFVPSGLVFNKVDVVDVVHSVCDDAAKHKGRIRSRFIRRLSPVAWLGKTLSDGLQKACEEILPDAFKVANVDTEARTSEVSSQPAHDTVTQGVKFAIRPSIRNNGKVSRDEVIKYVADQVQGLGMNKHKVDLKGYEKGILVEVYRGWIGISVVDNVGSSPDADAATGDSGKYQYGYEALKRFNLSEIYAEGFKKNDAQSTTRTEEGR